MDYMSGSKVASEQGLAANQASQLQRPRDSSPTELSFNSVENSLKRLDAVVGAMGNRLQPVLHSSPAPQSGAEARARMDVPIAEGIMTIADRINGYADQLDMLLGRLAI